MAAAEVGVHVNLYGAEAVSQFFEQLGSKAEAASGRVSAASGSMDVSWKHLTMTTAGMMANSIQLGDLMDRVAKGQMDVGRGAMMLAMNFLQLAAQIWTVVTAEKARGTAHTIAHALSGPAGWAILAGAAVAAAAGMALVSQVPKAGRGGVFDEPTVIQVGEAGREWVIPDAELQSMQKAAPLRAQSSLNPIVNIYYPRDYDEAKRGAFDGTMQAMRLARTA